MTSNAGDAAEARHGDIGVGWYLAALIGYVAIGYATQSVVLNWIVGPLFPFIVLYLGPTLVTRVRSRIGPGS